MLSGELWIIKVCERMQRGFAAIVKPFRSDFYIDCTASAKRFYSYSATNAKPFRNDFPAITKRLQSNFAVI
jgi:hypothetical protein